MSKSLKKLQTWGLQVAPLLSCSRSRSQKSVSKSFISCSTADTGFSGLRATCGYSFPSPAYASSAAPKPSAACPLGSGLHPRCLFASGLSVAVCLPRRCSIVWMYHEDKCPCSSANFSQHFRVRGWGESEEGPTSPGS